MPYRASNSSACRTAELAYRDLVHANAFGRYGAHHCFADAAFRVVISTVTRRLPVSRAFDKRAAASTGLMQNRSITRTLTPSPASFSAALRASKSVTPPVTIVMSSRVRAPHDLQLSNAEWLLRIVNDGCLRAGRADVGHALMFGCQSHGTLSGNASLG
jgi:hypothetical protein